MAGGAQARALERQLATNGKYPVRTPTGRQLEQVAEELGREAGCLPPGRSSTELATLVEFIRGLAREGEEQSEESLAGLRLRVESLERQLVEQRKRPVQTPTGRQLEQVAELLGHAARGTSSGRTMVEVATLEELLRGFARWG